jgi:hypothetical protein
LLRISIIRGNGSPDRNTDFPFFCLPNWAIHSIDRNQQNSGPKTNYFRFSKAGLIPNRLFISFLFPKWSAPNGPATCCAGFSIYHFRFISQMLAQAAKDETGAAWLLVPARVFHLYFSIEDFYRHGM